MRNSMIAVGAMVMSFQVMASGTAVINGKEIKSPADLHTILAKQLSFQSYGKNLDSLYDVLSTDVSGQTFIRIKSLNILKSKLGPDYTEALIDAITDASENNPKIVLLVE